MLFADVSFSLRPGECCELRGRNGSGKTSLLRMLSGMLTPSRGEVLWNGISISECRDLYLPSLTYIGHRPAIKGELTVLENLRISVALSGWRLSEDEARDALRRLGLGPLQALRGRQLSDGQQRRLALARLLVSGSALWLLDEVLTSLDEETARGMAALVDAHLARGGMVVMSTHQPLGLTHCVSHRIELAA